MSKKKKVVRKSLVAGPRPTRRPRRPFPWLALALTLLAVFGFWVAPRIWPRGPATVVFEESK